MLTRFRSTPIAVSVLLATAAVVLTPAIHSAAHPSHAHHGQGHHHHGAEHPHTCPAHPEAPPEHDHSQSDCPVCQLIQIISSGVLVTLDSEEFESSPIHAAWTPIAPHVDARDLGVPPLRGPPPSA